MSGTEIGWTLGDAKRRRDRMEAVAFVRHNMAEAASLRNKASVAGRRSGEFLLDAEMLEKRAQAMAQEFNLGDARYV